MLKMQLFPPQATLFISVATRNRKFYNKKTDSEGISNSRLPAAFRHLLPIGDGVMFAVKE